MCLSPFPRKGRKCGGPRAESWRKATNRANLHEYEIAANHLTAASPLKPGAYRLKPHQIVKEQAGRGRLLSAAAAPATDIPPVNYSRRRFGRQGALDQSRRSFFGDCLRQPIGAIFVSVNSAGFSFVISQAIGCDQTTPSSGAIQLYGRAAETRSESLDNTEMIALTIIEALEYAANVADLGAFR